ncbi:phosphodiesterase [Corticibacter populi]|uniref:Phosphodiesterase n=1 Tax=Corticibacter populi TaxID=1550736 RepID=A0A3M6QI61_9BURK|nr:phosphodiesterase [Corticibacter populi]RMX02625.1 phosphodiesterase [Corticibacter populi]RZS32958.1 hypothetical protein EV687_1272 [Corticibacter populi]
MSYALIDLENINEQSYENLLALWADLEAALNSALQHPDRVGDFPTKLAELRRWLEDMIQQDSDTALYLMFQLASTSMAGYSASHALVCASLCHMVAPPLGLGPHERVTLLHAAMSMNIGMTGLQDELALQTERPTLLQEQAIQDHPQAGVQLLRSLGVIDPLWLEVIAHHHTPPAERLPLQSLNTTQRLTRVLASIDRYAAMISPRKSRPDRSVGDSLRAIMGQRFDPRDEVGKALAATAGLYPPGTLVKLDTQEIAVVLRRTQEPKYPMVAGIIDSKGRPYERPPLYLTASGKPRIINSLPLSAISFSLDHRTMVSLGLFTARQAAGTQG